ncbi:hypothetical protein AgCh_039666 [Apium graveolens]
MDIWVQLYDMNSGFMSLRVVKDVGNYIGTFIESDVNNFTGVWREYLRVRVSISLDLPLKRRMKLRKNADEWSWVNFKYEGAPTFCFIYGLIGHSDKFCEKLFEMPEEMIAKPFGSWMRAEPRRKNYTIGAKWLRPGGGSPAVKSGEKEDSVTGKVVTDISGIAYQKGEKDGMLIDISNDDKGISHGENQGNNLNIVKAGYLNNIMFKIIIPSKVKMEKIQRLLNYEGMVVVEAQGRSGGMALLWKEEDKVNLRSFSNNHIDIETTTLGRGSWRFTGFYGEPNRANRRKTWELLKNLARDANLSWCVMGDLNNIVDRREKRGGDPYPQWLIEGFNEILTDSGLIDMNIIGHQFTWERSRGMENWIETRLDRLLTNESWLENFAMSKLYNLEDSPSDHNPIYLDTRFMFSVQRPVRRFRFENAWLIKPMCFQLVEDSWEENAGEDIRRKVLHCCQKLEVWGKEVTGNFSGRVKECKVELKKLRRKIDQASLERFKENFDGDWINWEEGLSELITTYYDKMFTATETQWEEIVNKVPSSITEVQNKELLREVSVEEVRSALFHMHPDKSLGPNGMTPGFFQKHWSLVRNDIVLMVKKFFTEGVLLDGLNDTNLVLIPKKKNPSSVSDLRPISLCNVLVKIITKVMANRLKVLLDVVVSESQSAFIPGRLISDNILVSYEVMHSLKNKRYGKEGYMAIKLDMNKAYDRLEWDFVKAMLRRMGFSEHWIKLIMACITSVSYKIVHGEHTMGPITPSRGIRQGDPLSPYLFIICAEGLSALLNHYESRNWIHGIKVCRHAPAISHMLFADDSYMYCKANTEEAGRVMELLRHNKYLGLPNLLGQKKSVLLGFLKDGIENKIRTWERKPVSKSGQEILIKMVGQALPTYAMSVFLLPMDLIKNIEKMLTKYWWNSTQRGNRKIHWASWEKLCKHKSTGGLDFRDFRSFNLAMLGKQGWRFLSNPDSLVSRVYKARYFREGNFLVAKLGANPSFTWRSVWEAREVVSAGACWQIRSGGDVNIIGQPWLANTGNPYISTECEAIQNNKVQGLMCIDKREWDKEVILDLFNRRDQKCILDTPISKNGSGDTIIWNLEKSGMYTVKSAYRLIQRMKGMFNMEERSKVLMKLWKLKAPP